MVEEEEFFKEVEQKVLVELWTLFKIIEKVGESFHKNRDMVREEFGESMYKTLAAKFYGLWILYGWAEIKPLIGQEYLELSRAKIRDLTSGIGEKVT